MVDNQWCGRTPKGSSLSVCSFGFGGDQRASAKIVGSSLNEILNLFI